MAKDKTKPMYNKQLALKEGKKHFLSLCEMYNRMGQLFSLQAKVLTHPMFAKTSISQIQSNLLEQFQEIGEEMKVVGSCLDLLGGKAVMKAPEKKKEEKKKDDKEIFVSNIKPKKPTKRACQDDVGDGFDFDDPENEKLTGENKPPTNY